MTLIGVWLLVRSRAARHDRAAAIDAAIITVGAALVSWEFLAAVARLMLPVLGAALLNHGLAQQTVADAALVFAGIPLAVLALVAAVTLWRDRRQTAVI